MFTTQMLAITDVRTVQAMLDHGDVRVTMRYAHNVSKRVTAAAMAFDSLLSGA